MFTQSLVLLFLFSCIDSRNIETLQVHDHAEWTVAVYMNGDNNLEYCITGGIWHPECLPPIGKDRRSWCDSRGSLLNQPGSLLDQPGSPIDVIKNQFVIKGDFHNELANPGSSSNVHIVALVDRTPGYSNNMDNWTETRLYYINSGDYPDNTRGTYWVDAMSPEKNMGDPNTLIWFLKTVQGYFPSTHLYLSMWDHNWGWHDNNFEIDFTNDKDTISYGSLYDTLSDFIPVGDNIDVIGYDACVSSQIEVLHTWAPFVRQFAGSQDYIGWGGVNYTYVLNYLEKEPVLVAPKDLAVRIAESMLTDPQVGCASSIDVKSNHFYELIQNIDQLGFLFIKNLDDIRDELIRIRNLVPQVPSDSEVDEFHKDLFQIATELLEDEFFVHNYDDIKFIALEIIKNINKIVLYNEINDNLSSCYGGHGITIYWTQSGQKPTLDYYSLSFSRTNPVVQGAPHWAQFLTIF